MLINNIKKDKIIQTITYLIMLIGVFLRIKVYLYNRPFWHDECSLASSVLFKNYFSLWGVLDHMQSAPPLFMTASKLLFNLFPSHPELSMRLIPCITSIASIFIFYLLLKKIFSNHYIELIGIFLITFNLIYFLIGWQVALCLDHRFWNLKLLPRSSFLVYYLQNLPNSLLMFTRKP